MKVGETVFVRTQFEGLDGRKTVGFAPSSQAFTIYATKGGLRLHGEFEVTTEPELQDFAKLVSEAWKEHRRLKPNLKLNEAGH